MKPLHTVIFLISCLAALCLCGCDQGRPPEKNRRPAQPKTNVSLSIVSGSENKTLEPLLKQFGRQHNIHIRVDYMGSVDIAHEIGKGTGSPFDAVWPASGLWLSLGDKQGVIKHAKSIMRSPVVFAIKNREISALP